MKTDKQKAIELAYGEYWEQVKDYVDENGWCNAYWNICEILNGICKPKSQGTKWRPKSLQGIENNNGWIEGIPSENGFYFIEYINKNSDIKEFKDNLECINWFKLNVKKHQKISFPKSSIF